MDEARKPADERPPIPGARKAPDGFWYLPDPMRPGKYLRLVPLDEPASPPTPAKRVMMGDLRARLVPMPTSLPTPAKRTRADELRDMGFKVPPATGEGFGLPLSGPRPPTKKPGE